MSKQQTGKIWAVCMAPGSRMTPVHVSRSIVGTPAWKIHKMKEVADPTADPMPLRSAGPTKAEAATIARLEKERDELLAKLAAANAANAAPEPPKEPKEKKPATQPQTA